MGRSEELKALIVNEVLPEIEVYIDDLFKLIANNKKVQPQDREDLEEAQELREEFKLLLEDLEAGDIDENESIEIIEEIAQMRKMEE